MKHSTNKENNRIVEFMSEDVPTTDAIFSALFPEFDSNSPKSINYKRKLIRPKMKWNKLFLHIVIFIALVICAFIIAINICLNNAIALLSSTIVALIIMLVRIKSILICLIELYQYFAPDTLRNKCRFEPSCSEYMKKSIIKYGTFKGLIKGLNRLKRCNINDGGYDEPYP